MADFNAFILPVLFGVGYWAIGFIESKLQPTAEPFDLKRTIRTLGSGLVIGFVQGIAGAAIDPSLVTTWPELGGLIVIAFNKVMNLYSAPAAAAAPPATKTPAAAVAAEQPTTGPTGQPYGLVKVLGFYGPSAYANEPKLSQTYPIMQVPMLYFDLVCERAGKLMYAIWIDGKPAHNYEEIGEDFQTAGDRRAVSFDYPTLVKTPGTHVLSFKTGHDVMPGTVWDQEYVFSITFTGVFIPD